MERTKLLAIKDHLGAKEFTILIGARQTGKSTILRQLNDFLKKQKYKSVLLNLERQEILNDLNQSPEAIFRYLPLQENEKIFVLIDEIQYLKNPTNFLKLLYDEYHNRLKIITTGSTAFYIDRQFDDSLVGRKKIFELKTLDFEEFLLFKNQHDLLEVLIDFKANRISKSPLENKIWMSLDEYMTYGGYPAVVLETNPQKKIERLAELRDSFVKRDMLEANIQDEEKFFKLIVLLASQIGNLLNINELSNTLRLSNHHVENYLFVLQKCFYVSLAKPFYQHLRKELTKMPKLYFNDLGLRNVLVNYFAPIEQRADKGSLLENLVFRQLSDQYSVDQVKFWRTADGNEVDFVIEERFGQGQAIEVKFGMAEAKISKYKKFIEEYPSYPLSFYVWKDPLLLK
jgi:predicted AAA+ superfamily ATPase